MRRKLTRTQRQAITKSAALVFCLALFCVSVMFVPYIASAIPYVLIYPEAEPAVYASPSDANVIADVPLISLIGSDFEEEEPIPIPEKQIGDLPVSEVNLCWYEQPEQAALHIINRTDYKVDLNDFVKRDYPISGSRSVLIIHTHGSESYLQNGTDYYSPTETFRSDNRERTVISAGNVLAQTLIQNGITVYHDTTAYDIENFNAAYTNARAAIKEWLLLYPDIGYVIDVHRDSVFSADGENKKPVTLIQDIKTAQIMLVIGTDEGGASHPDWRDNLTVASHLQSKLNKLYPTLARPINLRTAAFNQALTKGSMILEIGACGNTVEEAQNAALLFGTAFSQLYFEYLT